jgi:polysaccharide biosynthesis/export protein
MYPSVINLRKRGFEIMATPLYLLRCSAGIALRGCLLMTLLINLHTLAEAQNANGSAGAPPVSSSPSAPAQAVVAAPVAEQARDERYRIGPGDLLDIRVFNKAQFSRDGVRVDSRGMIRMPFIESEIKAACRTEAELAAEVTRLLLEYVRRPQVDVFIKEYQSQPVAVLGAVRAPSRFQLQRRVRLLELLSFVNGPSDNAGRTIQIVHAASSSICEESRLEASAELAAIEHYSLSETLRGDVSANPYVRAGDIVSVSEADQVYIVGNVTRPSALPLREPITISRAIAMVGGTLPDTRKERVRIVRQTAGTAKTEIYVDLRAIDKRQAEDIELLANDIVDVPTNSGKRLLKSFIGAIVPSVAQLPVRVVP